MNGLGQLLASLEVEYKEELLKETLTESQKLARYLEKRRLIFDKYKDQAYLYLGKSTGRVLTEILDNTLLTFECEHWRDLQTTQEHVQFPQYDTINLHKCNHLHAQEEDILCYRSRPASQTFDHGYVWHGRIKEILTYGYHKRRYVVACLEMRGDFELVYGSQVVAVISSHTPEKQTPVPLGVDIEKDTQPDLQAL